jgi:hypothetical protein
VQSPEFKLLFCQKIKQNKKKQRAGFYMKSPSWGSDLNEKYFMLAPVAHECNPSYSGGRDQENQGSKPAPDKLV